MMKLKKVNKIIISVTLIINVVFIGLTLFDRYNSNLLVCISLFPIIFIPTILNKYTQIKISNSTELIFLSFVFIAQLLGSVIHFYDLISWFDSFVHFISGIFTALLALQLLVVFDKYNPKHKVFNILFLVAITFMIAGCWEIFEFTGDNIFGNNAQKVETGVRDTMKDIICALLGSTLFLVYYLYDIINDNNLKKLICGIKK